MQVRDQQQRLVPRQNARTARLGRLTERPGAAPYCALQVSVAAIDLTVIAGLRATSTNRAFEQSRVAAVVKGYAAVRSAGGRRRWPGALSSDGL